MSLFEDLKTCMSSNTGFDDIHVIKFGFAAANEISFPRQMKFHCRIKKLESADAMREYSIR